MPFSRGPAFSSHLHWADRATLQLLTHLARELARARILVVGTYRDTDLDRRHPLSQALAEMNREELFSRIPLRGLTEHEVLGYIARTAGVEPAPGLARRVFEETEGNPFFLAEVVNLMTQEGTLAAGRGDVAIPEGVREALGRRLDRLSAEANTLLGMLAVVGREFEHALVLALSERDDESTLLLVEEALRARVLEEIGTGQYRFTHALMQETLLGELSAARQVQLHGRIARAIEALHGIENRDFVGEIARHYRESAVLNHADAEQAIRLTARAAGYAEAAVAWDEASELLQAALALAEEHGAPADVDVARLHWRLAFAARWLSDVKRAIASFQAANAMFAGRGDALSAGELAAELLTPLILCQPGLLPRSLNLVALREMGGEQGARADIVAQLRLNAIGYVPKLSDEREVDSIASLVREHALGSQQAAVDVRRAGLAVARGRLDDAERAYRESADGFEMNGPVAPANLSRDLEAWAAMNLRGLDAALPILRRASEGATRLRSMASIGRAVAHDAAMLALRGRLGDAQDLAAADMTNRGLTRLVQARVSGVRGEIHSALGFVDDPEAPGQPIYRFGRPALRARLLLEAGDTAAARTSLAEWLDVRADTFLPSTDFDALACADDAIVRLPTAELVRDTYELLVAQPQMRTTWFGTLDHLRGRLALRLDRPLEEAEQHFRTGLEWCERERCPVEAGRNLQGLAQVAERRGDIEAARTHLDAAGALFAKHGAKLYLDEVLAKKQVLEA